MQSDISDPSLVLQDSFRDAGRPADLFEITSESHTRSPTPQGSRPYRRRLANLSNVRVALADVIRALESDQMEANKARALVYALSTLAGIIQGTDVEDRLAKLESGAAHAARGNGGRG
jgi:hypothetical protein